MMSFYFKASPQSSEFSNVNKLQKDKFQELAAREKRSDDMIFLRFVCIARLKPKVRRSA